MIRVARFSIVCLGVLLVFPDASVGQTTPKGSVYSDEAWSGEILISAEVRISGATIRVAPGSTIRFVSPVVDREAPTLYLSGGVVSTGRSAGARLILAGTSDQPITVETPDGRPPGAITANPVAGCSLIARHVIFRRIGAPITARRARPAIFLVLTSPDNDLWVSDCRFEQCGPIHAEFIGAGATAEIRRCTFADTVGANAIEMIGTGDGTRVVSDNVADAAFHIECSQVLVQDNVLVGESAAVSVPNPAATAITIADNYVHCTTPRDEGRYALKCNAGGLSAVSGNVLRGGTYVMESTPKNVSGNVLIGAAGLKADVAIQGLSVKRLESGTTTHFLMTNLAPGASVTDNLFLGPAYASLAVDRDSTSPRIENNFFDGWQTARRAVHFNMLRRRQDQLPIGAVLTRNVFTRYPVSPIADGARQAGTLATIRHNLFADVPDPVYDDIPEAAALADGDRRLESFGQLALYAPAATQAALDVDVELIHRRITVTDVRRMWFDAYRPRAESPLIGPQPAGPRSIPGDGE